MFKSTLISIALILSPVLASAGHHEAMKEPTKEERAQMAEMHTKMAACLKSEKTMADCHKEMMDSCPMAKKGQCPMMGMGHPHPDHGKHKGKDKKSE